MRGFPGVPGALAPAGEVLRGRHAGRHGERDWRLYVPPGDAAAARPLLLMLHGCAQDGEDFARGTGMDALAREAGWFVLYPTQSEAVNPQRCWNWFKRQHQRRGWGEPAWLADLVHEVAARHAVDRARICVAGLSAGGAMAALLGHTHPDLFAAVGVHSGLPAGAAHDLRSAYAAMRRGPPAPAPGGARPAPPTIVFHGEDDRVVHPDNGRAAVRDALVAGTSAVVEAPPEPVREGWRRAALRQRWFDGSGRVLAEHWSVPRAGHAWSGGSAAGSFTDPAGPDASRAMLAFFAQQRL